jgi:hypothetical protein
MWLPIYHIDLGKETAANTNTVIELVKDILSEGYKKQKIELEQ